MTTQTTTSEYLVICRGARCDEGLSPEDTQNTMKQFYPWFERMSDQGKMKSGHQLAPEGKILSGRKGVTDGPFAESKEGIADYWFIQAASLEEAVEIAKGDPLLDYGLSLSFPEIRSPSQGMDFTIYPSIAQRLERSPDKRKVSDSNPPGRTKLSTRDRSYNGRAAGS